MPHDSLPGWFRSPSFQLQLLIALSVLLGGGGVAYGIRNLVIQLAALAILSLNIDAVAQFWKHAPRALVVLVSASIALPLLQLVPLPASIWQSLPGRDLAAQSFAVAGLSADRWFTMSLDPMRTLVAFCGTFAPATLIVLGSTMEREHKTRLALWTIFIVSAAFALGVVQFASANTFGLLYAERTQADVFYATFANRNSTALMFVMALTLLASVPRPASVIWLLVYAVAGVFFALAAVLTQSRTGMALLAVPLGVLLIRGLALAFGKRSEGRIRPRTTFGIGLAALALATGALAASYASGGRVADSVDRFASAGAADRPEMWEDSLYAAGHYWPVGSGMGTFDEVFQLHESLEYVSARKAGRAHSDWLEIAIEGGVVSLAIAIGWLCWILVASVPRGVGEGMWLRLGAGAALGAVALQSLVDYPLRNQTLLCLAAVCIVLLVRLKEKRT